MSAASDPDPLVEYLLGRLPPEAAAELEGRSIDDDDLHEELLATADDLIHAYLVGSLTAEDRREFETHFLASPRRRERLNFLRTLLAAIERLQIAQPAPRRVPATMPAWSWAAVAAAAIAAVVAVVVVQAPRLPDPDGRRAFASPPLQVLPPRPAPAPSAEPPAPAPPPRASAPPVQRVRTVRIPRDAAEPVEIVLPAPTRTVRLEIGVDGTHPGYDVTLETPDGEVAWKAEGLTVSAQGRPVVAMVSADVFRRGDLVVALHGETLRGPALDRRYRLRVVAARRGGADRR